MDDELLAVGVGVAIALALDRVSGSQSAPSQDEGESTQQPDNSDSDMFGPDAGGQTSDTELQTQRGDINQNQRLDYDDIVQLESHLREGRDSYPPRYDVNQDGLVDAADWQHLFETLGGST